MLALALAAGCGTTVGWSGNKLLRVDSRPEQGAKIFVDGVDSGQVTPGTVELSPKKAAYSITCEKGDLKSGGQNVSRDIRTECVIFNCLNLWLFLWVDYMTGAMYDFPQNVTCTMGRPAQPSEPPPLPPPPQPRPPQPTQSDIDSTPLLTKPKKLCRVCGADRGENAVCPQCGAR